MADAAYPDLRQRLAVDAEKWAGRALDVQERGARLRRWERQAALVEARRESALCIRGADRFEEQSFAAQVAVGGRAAPD
jgi:hypothetical protein